MAAITAALGASPTESTNTQIDTKIPYYRSRPPRPMCNTGFRIFEDQKQRLDKEYDGKSSELIRELLDKYFREQAKKEL